MSVAAQIGEKIATAEALGSGGELDDCLKIMQEVDKIKLEKQAAEEEYRGSVPMSSQQAQKLRVCEVCSAYLSLYDNDRRLADHFGGKLHLGFVNVREKIAELREMIEEKNKSNKPRVLLYNRRRRYWEGADITRRDSWSPRRNSHSPSHCSPRYDNVVSREERGDGRSSSSRKHRHRRRSSSDERSHERRRSSRHKRSRHSRSRSHDRHKSRSHDRERSRSHGRHKSRSHDRERSRSHDRHESRSHDRERSRDKERSRSHDRGRRSRSHDRRRRSRSHDGDKRSRSHDRHKKRSHRHHHSRSRSRSRDRSRRRKRDRHGHKRDSRERSRHRRSASSSRERSPSRRRSPSVERNIDENSSHSD